MQDRKPDFGQLYGYTVCLVAVLAFLVACVELTGGVMDYREPPYTETYRDGPTLVSLGAYKMDLLSRVGVSEPAESAEALLPTDLTVERMYEAERLYRLALSHHVSRRSVLMNLVLLATAVLLFTSHSAWLRRRRRPPAP